MFSIILAVAMMGMNGLVAVLPKELEIPQNKMIKKSKGKGKGNVPYFAKYF